MDKTPLKESFYTYNQKYQKYEKIDRRAQTNNVLFTITERKQEQLRLAIWISENYVGTQSEKQIQAKQAVWLWRPKIGFLEELLFKK